MCIRDRVKTTNLQKQSATLINGAIQAFETAIDNVFTAFELEGISPTPDQIRAKFNLLAGRKSEHEIQPTKTFFDYFDDFTKEEGALNNWSRGTYVKFQNTRNHLTVYNPGLRFEDLTEAGLSNYATHLREVKNLQNSTIIKQIKLLKWFLPVSYTHLINASTEVDRQQQQVDMYAIRERINSLFFGTLLLEEQLKLNTLYDEELARNYQKVQSFIANGVANAADLDAVKVEMCIRDSPRTWASVNRTTTWSTNGSRISSNGTACYKCTATVRRLPAGSRHGSKHPAINPTGPQTCCRH